MSNIREIFSQAFGLSSDDQLNSLARILYHYKFDGIKRRFAPNDSNLKEILDKEFSEKELNGLLQKNIFQKIRGSRERQEINPSNHFSDETKQQFSDETKQQLMQDFEKIGFVAEVSPKPGKKYESVIIFGAAQKGMENRLNDFLEHFLPKINENPKEIFFLAGERDAWLDSESFAKEILLKRINYSLKGKNEAIKDEKELEAEIKKITLDEQRKLQVTHFTKKYGIKFPIETDIDKEILLERINRSPKINGINEKTLDDLNKEIQFISKITLDEQRRLQVRHFTEKYGITFPTETDIAKEIVESRKGDLEGFAITCINAERKPDGSRPNTADTLRELIKNVEEDFNLNAVMAISNQPYVSSQAMALKVDERLCDIDVVGKEGSREVGQLNSLASELAGGLYRYFALSKKQEQSIKSDQPLSSQGNPSQATANREIGVELAEKLDNGKEAVQRV